MKIDREPYPTACRVGDVLRQRRQLSGISQRDCADLTGLSVHTISDIESGKSNPTLSVLDKLLDCLGLEIIVQPRKVEPLSNTP